MRHFKRNFVKIELCFTSYSMTKNFEYNLTGTGWAEVIFTNDKKTVSFVASYLNDPLAELFEGLIKLKLGKTENEKIVFVEEPGEHSLILTKQQNGILKVEIYWNEEWEELYLGHKNPDYQYKKQLIYSDTDTIQNFISKICEGTDNLLKRLTLSEYKRLWSQYDFPIEIYIKIRQSKLLT